MSTFREFAEATFLPTFAPRSKVMTEVGLMDCVRVDGTAFKCHVCGVECPIAPQLPAKPVCAEHCEDHQYEYVRGEGHRCVSCFAEPPADSFED